MQRVSDSELLDQFARHASEDAFGKLVRRYIGLVHSIALRHTNNPHNAEEITQAVFIILARKAGSVGGKTILSGWLYHTARLTAANYRRSEFSRTRREQKAFMQSNQEKKPPDLAWHELVPLLDQAMARLGVTDRNAVVLRYFENKTLTEVGVALGMEERAAQKRVSRALKKLHRYFNRHGVSSTTAVIAGAISANSVQAAPTALAKTVTTLAVAKGALASSSTLTLIKGAMKLMAWTKAKSVLIVGVGLLLVAGTATITVKEIQDHRTYPWQVPGFNGQRLNQAPSQVAILRSKIRSGSSMGNTTAGKIMGTGVTAQSVVGAAYGVWRPTRTVPFTGLPDGRFDFIASLPDGDGEALQQEVKRKFGVVAKRETRETDVLLLKIQRSDASGLIPATARHVSVNENNNRLSFTGCTIDSLAANLEPILKIPVLNQTGLAGNFDIDLKWDDRNPEGLKQTVLDTLGLELVPGRVPVEMLVVEKVK